MKNYIIALAIISMVFISGCAAAEDLIGGQRDEHGCLGPAGYSWNDTLNTCIREWEVTDQLQREAIKLASEYIADRRDATGITLERIEVRDVGDFDVYLSTERFKFKVVIEDWDIVSETLLS